MTVIIQQALMPLAIIIATAIAGKVTSAAVKELRKHTRLKDLAFIAEVCGDALTAAMQAYNGQPMAGAILDARAAAKKVIVAALPAITEALGAELDTLISHNVAAAAGQPVTAPGGATVTLPRPI